MSTVRTGRRAPAKFGRTKFVQRFAFGRFWFGHRYASKQIEAIAVQEPGGWLVLTVIVKYF
jgi:hypothetical protein